MAEPARYWRHNLGGSLALLEAMRAAGTTKIVFSSTAAVYGEPGRVPIEEAAPPLPTSPYGASKLAVDTALAEHARMHGTGAVSLRYFNVAGAQAGPGGRWYGERHHPETHLIPSILAAAAAGATVRIYGDDYPTPDGTCVRDYIHVTDLAQAHLLALDACAPGVHEIFNLGTGTGYSNREVLAACEKVTGQEIPAEIAARRPGDPAVLVASAEKIRTARGWVPARSLHAMVSDAWQFSLQRSSRPAPAPGQAR
jgi:UDP-glucose 4-epimerase